MFNNLVADWLTEHVQPRTANSERANPEKASILRIADHPEVVLAY